MEKQKSIKTNMIMNIILTASNFVFPLITYSYVARVLMSEGTGKVAFVQSVLAYFTYVAALGVSGYGTRECAKIRDDKDVLSKTTQEILIINFISTIVAYIALIITIVLVPKFHDYTALFAVMSISILLQTLGMEWLYKALEQYTYITIRSIIFKIVAVVMTFILVRDADDVVAYGFITIFTTSASYVWNFINVRKYINFKKYSHYDLKRHLKPIMVFFMSSIIITIYGHFDTTMLGFIKGDSEVGLYNAALKMKSIVLSVSTAVTSVMIPRMSIYFDHHDELHFQSLLLKSLRVSCVLLLPLIAFVILSAEDVLLFVCGDEFLPAKNTLIILMFCCLALALTNIFGNQILIPKGDERRYSISVFIGMWINLGLNLLLIPQFSSAGAAIATLVTESFNVFWMGRGCINEIKYMMQNIKFVKYAIPILISIFFDYFVSSTLPDINVFFRLAINAGVVFGIYYTCLLINKEPLTREALGLVLSKMGLHIENNNNE